MMKLLGRGPWNNLAISDKPMPRWMQFYHGELSKGEESKPPGAWQWKWTPKQAVEGVVNFLTDLCSLKICVIINIEIVWWLIDKGVDPSNITFLSDCELREEFSMRGLNISTDRVANYKKHQKKFDLTITNPKFTDKDISKTEAICRIISKDRYIMLTDSAYYHNKESRLRNTEVFKHLGMVFYTEGNAKIGAVAVIKNLNSPDNMKVVGKDNKETSWPWSNGDPYSAPTDNSEDWEWAQNVLSKKLPGYDDCKKGAKISRTDVKFMKDGTTLIFTAGERGAEFDSKNFADEDLIKKWNTRQNISPSERKNQKGMDFNTKCWTTAEVTDQQYKDGGGQYNKAVASHSAPDTTGQLIWKFLPEGKVVGNNSWWFPVKDEADFNQEKSYFAEEKTRRLIKTFQAGAITGSKSLWKKIPRKEFKDQWN